MLSEGPLFTPLPTLAEGLVSTFVERTLRTLSLYQTVRAVFTRGEWMGRRKHSNKMSLADFWIALLACSAVCHAAPTIAPTVSPEEEDLAEVMQ